MTLLIPDSELWAVRDQALAVLLELAKDDEAEPTLRAQCAEVILIDIRETWAMATERAIDAQDARLEDAERIADELREELAKQRG